MIKRIKNAVFATGALVATGLSTAGSAMAEGPIDDMFAAVDISGVSTNITTLLISFIGVSVLFLCYKYVRRATNRA
jgi:uncharacterized membrane protein